ncbi:hypothetical protein [Streptomyces sp. DH10]|uniref:hypothetical protein n=1 Tax=Streptomyces sp. DH10 TaxID=3040121 RepID=UPI002440F1B7|nr:hypothetical protein [Streptomyces sp. DH10]MDG9711137.1 hypothetical protein [Streptomyces sp. DH10]
MNTDRFFLNGPAVTEADHIERAAHFAESKGRYSTAQVVRDMKRQRDRLKRRVTELEAKPKVPADVVSAAASIGAIYSTLKAEGMPENRAFEMTVKLVAQGAVK